jgi:hypothetical protein
VTWRTYLEKYATFETENVFPARYFEAYHTFWDFQVKINITIQSFG